jgi:hypothetical protein
MSDTAIDRWGKEGTCSACRFWHFDTGALGQCRRNAPVSAERADGKARGWAETYGYDGCGDYGHRYELPSPEAAG